MRLIRFLPLLAVSVRAGVVPTQFDWEVEADRALVTSMILEPSGGMLQGRQMPACPVSGCPGGISCCGASSKFCCPSGLSCAVGGAGCLGPAVAVTAVTATSTNYVYTTYMSTAFSTVTTSVLATSTIFSTQTVTSSNVDTATAVNYVTVTVTKMAKREANDVAPSLVPAPFTTFDHESVRRPQPRQLLLSTKTVATVYRTVTASTFRYVTALTTTTLRDVRAVTSIITTTVYQSAKTTVTVTSTITTEKVVQFTSSGGHTTVDNPSGSATDTATSAATDASTTSGGGGSGRGSDNSGNGQNTTTNTDGSLNLGAKIGIGLGAGVGGLLLLAAAYYVFVKPAVASKSSSSWDPNASYADAPTKPGWNSSAFGSQEQPFSAANSVGNPSSMAQPSSAHPGMSQPMAQANMNQPMVQPHASQPMVQPSGMEHNSAAQGLASTPSGTTNMPAYGSAPNATAGFAGPPPQGAELASVYTGGYSAAELSTTSPGPSELGTVSPGPSELMSHQSGQGDMSGRHELANMPYSQAQGTQELMGNNSYGQQNYRGVQTAGGSYAATWRVRDQNESPY